MTDSQSLGITFYAASSATTSITTRSEGSEWIRYIRVTDTALRLTV